MPTARLRFLFATVVVSLAVSACGPEDQIAPPPATGGARDGGGTNLDAGAAAPDAGDAVDGGSAEGVDAGSEPDAGTGPDVDAGTSGCALDTDCLDAAAPHCDKGTGLCLACLTDAHCPADAYCASGVCAPGCHADEGCTNTIEAFCETSQHRCVECAIDAQCAAGKICRDERCVEGCRTDAGCTGGAACCDDRCVDVSSNPANCGRCGASCQVGSNVEVSCTRGECGVGQCSDGYLDCNHDAADGCEVRASDDVLHCGSCARACPVGPHMRAAVCREGTCGVDCEPGFADCDGVPENGCEVDLVNDPTHCGMCDRTCAALPGTTGAACGSGLCLRGPCTADRGDCDGDPGNGCEIDISSDLGHCGSCTTRCESMANADVTCSSGSCASSCHAGFRDCDGSDENGCEITLGMVEHCRSCDEACPVPAGAAAATCDPVAGCGVTCPAGHAECDGNPATVCEASLSDDVLNCGACGHACPARADATPSCSQNTCGFTCHPGFADCDGDPANGCEVSLLTATEHCGSCTHACTGAANVDYVCDDGICADAACDQNFRDCDGSLANGCETDVRTSVQNCGACQAACPAKPHMAASCASGQCKYACVPGWADCDGDPANGCEVDIGTSLDNCGACGRACAFPNASGTCANGSCQLGTCASGYADCTTAAGCETATNTNTNCGGCGITCALANRPASCSTGTCAGGACNAGWGDCDGKPENGCETRLDTTDNCGGCGYRCDQTHNTSVCQSNRCVITSCSAGYGNCDAFMSNGCEQPLNTQTHCGACYTTPPEVCDGLSNDCDNWVDEGCPKAIDLTRTNSQVLDATNGSWDTSIGTATASSCPDGTLAVGQKVWATNDGANPYLTGVRLYCAEVKLEKVSPAKFAIKTGTVSLASDVGFSGPSTADHLCPTGTWLASVTYRTSMVNGHPYIIAVKEIGCRELWFELGSNVYSTVTGVQSFEIHTGPQTYYGPLLGWTTLPANDWNSLCPDGMVPQKMKAKAGWYLHQVQLECRQVGFTPIGGL